jgi:hypothetical protein
MLCLTLGSALAYAMRNSSPHMFSPMAAYGVMRFLSEHQVGKDIST